MRPAVDRAGQLLPYLQCTHELLAGRVATLPNLIFPHAASPVILLYLWRMISTLLGVGASGPLNRLGVFRRVPLLLKDYGHFQEVFLIAALFVQLL